jgi:hypothetical protein
MAGMLTHIDSGIRWLLYRPWRLARMLAVGMTLISHSVVAEEHLADLPDLPEVSYIHAAVMGSGTYLIKNRRITMFRLPLSWNQREVSPESVGWRWLMPVVVGYDDLGKIDSDIIEKLWPDQLVTLTVMPGIEFVYPVNENWHLKPFVEIGAGRDFSAGETFALSQLGVRSLNLYPLGERWTLRWGNSLRWAGEYQFDSKDQTGFGIFDTGLDLRLKLPWRLFNQRLDVGSYYVYERFLPTWTLGETEDWRGRTRELHEFGLSLGVQEGRKILGIPVKRIRIGYKKGGKLQGWTFGTEFPF